MKMYNCGLASLAMLVATACSPQQQADAAQAKRGKTATASGPKASQCKFSGWSTDPDPSGLNVRAGPSKTAKVIGSLPPAKKSEDFEIPFATMFDVVEAKDGWFRIENAAEWAVGQLEPSMLPKGWISGRFVGFNLQTEVGFAAPNPKSARVFQSATWEGPPTKRGITDCAGEWVKINYGPVSAPKQAWFRGVCGNQETSCDGVLGDESGLRNEE